MLNNNILDLVLVSVLDSILIGNGVNMSSRFVGVKDWVEELCILVSQIKIFLSLAFCLTLLEWEDWRFYPWLHVQSSTELEKAGHLACVIEFDLEDRGLSMC